MTPDQIAEMLDLYIDDVLPAALRVLIETHLTAHPEAVGEVLSLRETLTRLKDTPGERPDSWFVERTLDGLLRENASQAPTVASRRETTTDTFRLT